LIFIFISSNIKAALLTMVLLSLTGFPIHQPGTDIEAGSTQGDHVNTELCEATVATLESQ
jgi:hypothetical protein